MNETTETEDKPREPVNVGPVLELLARIEKSQDRLPGVVPCSSLEPTLVPTLRSLLGEIAELRSTVAILATSVDELVRDRKAFEAIVHEWQLDPGFDYETTTGPRKAFDEHDPDGSEETPSPTGWVRNVHRGREGWERFDYHEEAYWMRPKGWACVVENCSSKAIDGGIRCEEHQA